MKCTFHKGADTKCFIPSNGSKKPCTDCPTKKEAWGFIKLPESQKMIKEINDKLDKLIASEAK